MFYLNLKSEKQEINAKYEVKCLKQIVQYCITLNQYKTKQKNLEEEKYS